METMNVEQVLQNINAQLKDLKAKGYNIVGNVQYITAVPPLHHPALEIVEVNPDPAFKDVYKQKGGGLSMTAQCVRKFSNALNIIWRGGEVMQGSTERKIWFRAKASRKGIDGSWQHVEKDKEIDLDAIEDEIKIKNEDRGGYFLSGRCPKTDIPKSFRATNREQMEEWVAHQTKVEMVEKRKHKATNAQTGAQSRCVRDLGQLKGVYQPSELQKPFVVLKLIFHPDPNNPMDRQFLLNNSMGAVQSLYPGEATTPAMQLQAPALALPMPTNDPTAPPPMESLTFSGQDLGEVEPFVEPDPNAIGGVKEALEVEPSSEEGKALSLALDFEANEADGQIATLKTMMVARAYLPGALNKPLEQFTLAERLGFFEHLNTIPKAPATKTTPWT